MYKTRRKLRFQKHTLVEIDVYFLPYTRTRLITHNTDIRIIITHKGGGANLFAELSRKYIPHLFITTPPPHAYDICKTKALRMYMLL